MYQSGSQQESGGTFKEFNWKLFKEGTIYRDTSESNQENRNHAKYFDKENV